MGITLTEARAYGLVSEEVLDCIPEECECGSEYEFTESLKQIYCPNDRCSLKIAARLEGMAKAMNVDGWGQSTCENVCKHFNIQSPYQVFLLEGIEYDGVSAFKKKVEAICKSKNRKAQIWEMVMYAGIPSIDTIASKLFYGYNSIDEAYEDIKKGEVPFIAERLGINNSESGVMAVRIYNLLLKYYAELKFGETKFDICKSTGERLNIAITGGVEGYKSKSEFIRMINSRYNGEINAQLKNSVSSDVDILVADGDTNSNKYNTAIKMQEKGDDILIMGSMGIVEYLDKKYSGQDSD